VVSETKRQKIPTLFYLFTKFTYKSAVKFLHAKLMLVGAFLQTHFLRIIKFVKSTNFMRVCIAVAALCLPTKAAFTAQAETFNNASMQQQVVFISHPQNNSITLSDIKRLYSLSRKLLPNGDRAALAVLPLKNKESVNAFRFLLGLYPYQLQRKWDRAVFSGKGSQPDVFADSAALVEYVQNNKGAIGYVLVADNKELITLQEAVHVIAIVE
jgi:hypothetical protein